MVLELVTVILHSCVENESYQRFECTYLGKVETNSAYGIDTIVESLTSLSSETAQYRWMEVFMDIASSHIKILDRRVGNMYITNVVGIFIFGIFRMKTC